MPARVRRMMDQRAHVPECGRAGRRVHELTPHCRRAAGRPARTCTAPCAHHRVHANARVCTGVYLRAGGRGAACAPVNTWTPVRWLRVPARGTRGPVDHQHMPPHTCSRVRVAGRSRVDVGGAVRGRAKCALCSRLCQTPRRSSRTSSGAPLAPSASWAACTCGWRRPSTPSRTTGTCSRPRFGQEGTAGVGGVPQTWPRAPPGPRGLPQVIQGCGNPKVNPQGPGPEEQQRWSKLVLPEKPPTGALEKLVREPRPARPCGAGGWGRGGLGSGARWPDCCPTGL